MINLSNLWDSHKHHVMPHAVPAAVAAVVSVVVGTSGAYLMKAAPEHVVVSTSGKPNRLAWGEMNQKEIDALTGLLREIPVAKRDKVGILCANRECEDLALDFDNAIESAGWESGIERPLADTNTGIHVIGPSDRARAFAEAVNKATKGRIWPGILPQLVGDNRVLIVISRKAK